MEGSRNSRARYKAADVIGRGGTYALLIEICKSGLTTARRAELFAPMTSQTSAIWVSC